MQKEYKTKSREQIMEYVALHAHSRFSAADVWNFLRENGSQINITTIYRNLDKLSDSGILLKIKNAKDDSFVYQYLESDDCTNHLHITCKQCKKIRHIDHTFMDKINNGLLETYGFDLSCNESVLIGLCEECRK